ARLVVLLGSPHTRKDLKRFWTVFWPICCVALAPLILNVVSNAIEGSVARAFTSSLQRLALLPLVLLAFINMPKITWRFLDGGVVVAALVSAIILYDSSHGGAVRPSVSAQNLLNYVNFIALLGIYCLYQIRWQEFNKYWTVNSIRLLGFLAAGYSIYVSQSRGFLLALVCLVVLFIWHRTQPVRLVWKLGVCAVAIIVVTSIAMQSDRFTSRLERGFDTVATSIPALIQGEAPGGPDQSTW